LIETRKALAQGVGRLKGKKTGAYYYKAPRMAREARETGKRRPAHWRKGKGVLNGGCNEGFFPTTKKRKVIRGERHPMSDTRNNPSGYERKRINSSREGHGNKYRSRRTVSNKKAHGYPKLGHETLKKKKRGGETTPIVRPTLKIPDKREGKKRKKNKK